MKDWIARHFNLIMILAVILGLILPGLEHLPRSSGMILISIAIFFSCSKVTIEELRHINLKSALSFYGIRFLFLPIMVYYAALYTVPEYAIGVLLIALAPVGASAASIALLTRSNTSLALSSTVVTNALAPAAITVILYITLSEGANLRIDILNFFTTLGLSIFLPAFLYFAVIRKIEKVKYIVRRDAGFYATICIALMIAIVTALEKNYILDNLDDVFFMVLTGCVLFAVLYGAAWLFFMRGNPTDRKTYILCSGVNNTGLSSGLALLYFPPEVIVFTIVAEIPWTLGIIAFKKYADKIE
ncbi:MAG: bile acid:sodium symporter [Alphaproteobacteria bacterium]|nr:bile acid:sodium symporter [Alphaproteobacteria bacterium]